jgi:hypothetical protein
MRRAILIAVLSCFVAIGEATAQSSEMTFTVLLTACTKADYEWIGFCNGYLQAAFDFTGDKGFCAPKASRGIKYSTPSSLN